MKIRVGTWWSNSARSIARTSLWSCRSIGCVISLTGGFTKHWNISTEDSWVTQYSLYSKCKHVTEMEKVWVVNWTQDFESKMGTSGSSVVHGSPVSFASLPLSSFHVSSSQILPLSPSPFPALNYSIHVIIQFKNQWKIDSINQFVASE